MKKYIDYLFWKRTWFRVGFIMLPTWMMVPMVCGWFGEHDSALRSFWMLVYVVTWIVAISDNDEVDSPPNPFRAKINQWAMAYQYRMVQKFMDDNRKWTDQTFGDITTVATLRHLLKEVGETIDAIEEEEGGVAGVTNTRRYCTRKDNAVHLREKAKSEFYDCYLLLLNAASRYKLTFKEMHEGGIGKMEINRVRKWGPVNMDGFVEHIKEEKSKNA